jgi:Tfp pilus assembly protein PilF
MSQRTKVTGTRSCVLWLLALIAAVLVVGIAAGVLFVLPQVQEEQAMEQHYQAGVAFQNMGDWAAAEEEYKQVIALDANYKDVQARLAEVKAKVAENAATATAVAVTQAEQAQADAQATAAAAPTATAEALEAHY